MQQYDDIDVIQQLQVNDVAAFDILYNKYHIAIYNNVLKLTRNPIIAEDIVQETFIKLWEKRNTLDINKNISGWLFLVSHNLTIDYLRKQVKEIAREVLPENISVNHADEELKATEEQWQILEDAIQLLSPQKKKVFELCKLQGKTYEQAANELGISKHTIKEYLSEAVMFIKKYVQDKQMLQFFAGSVFFLENFLS
ncbi:MAG: sigma-70 family RNA polymerase sigma factor [Chitinophagaceae bacterium]|nr:MAG: sigma-70 family RNA polymerase sigma factor [Chitinophagaceae bacterium]